MGLQGILSSFKLGGGKAKASPSDAAPRPIKVAESPIAIDFGTSALKVLQVIQGDTPQFISAASMPVPADIISDHKRRLELQFQALPKLVKSVDFRGKRAVCAIPAWQTIVKHLQFPKTDPSHLRGLVEGLIPQHFNADPSMLVYRTIEIAGAPGKTDVIVIAARRDAVQRIMEAIVAAKLEPVGMQSAYVCLIKSFEHLQRRQGDESLNSMYLDVGAMTTTVAIAHGRDLAFARTINIGGWHLDECIAKHTGCDIESARTQRLSVGTVGNAVAMLPAPNKELQPDIDRRSGETPSGFSGEVTHGPAFAVGPAGINFSEPLETLTDELKLCMRYHASQFPQRKIERVIFVGGEVRHKGFTQHLARALRQPAQVADPMARVARTNNEKVVGVDFKVPQPGWAVGLGLALSPTDL